MQTNITEEYWDQLFLGKCNVVKQSPPIYHDTFVTLGLQRVLILIVKTLIKLFKPVKFIDRATHTNTKTSIRFSARHHTFY